MRLLVFTGFFLLGGLSALYMEDKEYFNVCCVLLTAVAFASVSHLLIP